ncbi:MAG TPA: polyamine aminopropyltransferase [Candidatus Thiothrix moscowensis]|uniref:polyamine aminopropyltransferase n=1 Tax=unclassified Thiothrix TaxID=2636184 RepID=UPI0025DDD451|nr:MULTISPECIES: polyamine aminopropyltransferase [unclassified Thiothrix]HRJ51129.1 polyamine aminopropyltransferase [Candidatus Thiothrix moscowensis]HRJ91816.1 polyamine aminopropyltransferase [Candidatus Thiothrix moscowensis]
MTEAGKFHQQLALLAAAFVIAICGLIYELLAGTLSSYLLGDSVYQFSLVIGLFMSSMGVGAWWSRFLEQELPRQFIRLQLLIGVLGGLSAPLLFFAFAILDNYTPLLLVLVFLQGAMLGIEIPLIIRILQEHFSLRVNVSNVFTADYIGALLAALLFPLVLVPQLGLLQTGFLTGLLNVVVGVLALYVFRAEIPRLRPLLLASVVAVVMLLVGFAWSERFTSAMENRLYQDEIIFTQDSQFQQRLILTRRGERIRFYLNGALQFDSFDEYRYHESLVHPVMGLVRDPANVLILGGGDGLAARELLRYPTVKQITLVDLDPAVTQLFKANPLLRPLNQDSLNNPRVQVVNQDAWKFLEASPQLYDAIFIDLPDPNNTSLSRLYSTAFYTLVKQHLAQTGVMVTQATSPLYSRQAFWCIDATMQQAGGEVVKQERWFTLPYHVHVPSFGEWGFVMASRQPLRPQQVQLAGLEYRFLNTVILSQLFEFPSDMGRVAVEPNQLSTHPLLRYYEAGWAQWYQ